MVGTGKIFVQLLAAINWKIHYQDWDMKWGGVGKQNAIALWVVTAALGGIISGTDALRKC